METVSIEGWLKSLSIKDLKDMQVRIKTNTATGVSNNNLIKQSTNFIIYFVVTDLTQATSRAM